MFITLFDIFAEIANLHSSLNNVHGVKEVKTLVKYPYVYHNPFSGSG